EDAQRQPELKKRLQDRVRAKFGALVVLLALLVLPVGCMRTRTVYIPPGEPVRLRETVKNVKIWTVDKNGKPVPGKVNLAEGWYCLPDMKE
ncbi:MAG: hypothetical protein JXA11_06915, partial [Phycisphaerae bacterium]|nr:hypothetical protein [Phycisphaerae bacterium]